MIHKNTLLLLFCALLLNGCNKTGSDNSSPDSPDNSDPNASAASCATGTNLVPQDPTVPTCTNYSSASEVQCIFGSSVAAFETEDPSYGFSLGSSDCREKWTTAPAGTTLYYFLSVEPFASVGDAQNQYNIVSCEHYPYSANVVNDIGIGDTSCLAIDGVCVGVIYFMKKTTVVGIEFDADIYQSSDPGCTEVQDSAKALAILIADKI